jgi:hypothetical protein
MKYQQKLGTGKGNKMKTWSMKSLTTIRTENRIRNIREAIANDERQIERTLAWMDETQDEEILRHHRASLGNLRRLKAEAERELATIEEGK